MRLTPLFEKIVVQPLNGPTTTSGGIVLPADAQDGPERGIVVTCGKGPLASDGSYGPMPVEKGDEVVYEHGSAREVEIDGTKFHVVQLRSIIGVVSR